MRGAERPTRELRLLKSLSCPMLAYSIRVVAHVPEHSALLVNAPEDAALFFRQRIGKLSQTFHFPAAVLPYHPQ